MTNAFALGANLLVHKPFTPSAMVQLLREVQDSPHYQETMTTPDRCHHEPSGC